MKEYILLYSSEGGKILNEANYFFGLLQSRRLGLLIITGGLGTVQGSSCLGVKSSATLKETTSQKIFVNFLEI